MNSLSIALQSEHKISNKVSDIMTCIAPYIEVKNEKKLREVLEHHFATDQHKDCFCTTFGSICDYALLCPTRSNQNT